MVIEVLSRPLYSIGGAARLLEIPPATLRWWLEGGTRRGRHYPPVLRSEPIGSDEVTWAEFVEAGLLRGYRGRGVPLQKMRPFINAMRDHFGVPYPLAHYRPLVLDRGLVHGLQVDIGLDMRLYLVHVEGGQMFMSTAVEEFLQKVDFEGDVVGRMHPLGKKSPVTIDPELAFGIPQIRGLRTESLAEAVFAGESIEDVALAWRISAEDVLAAVKWERRLTAA